LFAIASEAIPAFRVVFDCKTCGLYGIAQPSYNHGFATLSTVLKKFWLFFAQACTLCVAALFVVATLRPDLLPRLAGKTNAVVLLQQPAAGVAPAVASYADAARKAMPAVVNIYTSKALPSRNPLLDDSLLQRYFPELAQSLPARRTTSLGSGVIVAPEGYILTNHHVIDGADDIEVVLADGRELHAHVRGVDPESDLAVLKAEGDKLPAITFGTMEHLHVGDVVLAIGNPFGFGNTVTMGIVSALGRNHLGINRFEDFIQTDAPINPGNSGGALVDTAGNLVGINSTIFSQSGGSMGIGFAIPVSLAQSVLAQIIKEGEVTRGWLGVEPQAITRDVAQTLSLARADGVLIRALERNGPADRAGIEVRDVVVEVAGKPTPDVPKLLARIAELRPGTNAKVKLIRGGKTLDVDVVVAKRPRPTTP
jgi:serine protease DegQ